MLLPIPPQFRRRRSRPKAAAGVPAPAPLALVAASYTPSEGGSDPLLTLQFSRPIDASGFIIEAFLVRDTEASFQYYVPSSWGMNDPQTVEFTLLATEPASGSGVILNVTEGNGIVAVDDGEPWAGVSELPLPWP